MTTMSNWTIMYEKQGRMMKAAELKAKMLERMTRLLGVLSGMENSSTLRNP